MASIIPKDTELTFPAFTVISASAGSGKTHTLTFKLLQLLLSQRIPNNDLHNILAMTFTINAAREMKTRLLETLKLATFGDARTLAELQTVLALDETTLRSRSAALVSDMLDRYSDLHLQTIDSFLARVFRASALEFGFAPQTEISMQPDALIHEAFDEVVQLFSAEADGKHILEQLVKQMVDVQDAKSKFIWNPYNRLRTEVVGLFSFLTAQAHDLLPVEDPSDALAELRAKILSEYKQYRGVVERTGLERAKWFAELCESSKEIIIDKLARTTFKQHPIKKPTKRAELDSYEQTLAKLEPAEQRIKKISEQYYVLLASSFYRPYVEMHRMLQTTVETLKRREGQLYIGDVGKKLSTFLQQATVPEMYFNLGEELAHYLIDEFQDTSPIQWANLRPLFENALSQRGSLFVVGDTKQSIYSFRGADWRIMKQLLERQEFPSVDTTVQSLDTNYRSSKRILQFNEDVFHRAVPAIVDDGAAAASGLATYTQEAHTNAVEGYVEIDPFAPDAEPESEKKKLLEIVRECRARGFRYSDIAVLTPKNQDVVNVSGWLNEAGIEFISHSSLDVRTRDVAGELLALLRFLDSPVDNVSFATVILGKIFAVNLGAAHSGSAERFHAFLVDVQNRHKRTAVYTEFRKQFPELWETYFAELYRLVGYLPMYDLAATIYKTFRLYELLPDEESTLVKFLDVIKDFEERGENSLKDFIEFADDDADDGTWTINIPADTDAVTVMTIHKAKGLGFPVVLALLYDTKNRNDNRFMEETESGIKLYHITKEMAERSGQLQFLYREQRLREHVDELNKLYVALTRAKQEMYILSVQHKTMDKPSTYLPPTGYEPSIKPEVTQEHERPRNTAPLLHAQQFSPLKQATVSERLRWNERRRGDFVHAILSRIEFVEADLPSQLHRLVKEVSTEFPEVIDAFALENALLEFFALDDAQQWFETKPNRIVMNEQEFVWATGQLFRMDRVIVDGNAVMILDYKTGEEKDAYREQIDGYLQILREIYPGKTIHAALAYIDQKFIRQMA